MQGIVGDRQTRRKEAVLNMLLSQGFRQKTHTNSQSGNTHVYRKQPYLQNTYSDHKLVGVFWGGCSD